MLEGVKKNKEIRGLVDQGSTDKRPELIWKGVVPYSTVIR